MVAQRAETGGIVVQEPTRAKSPGPAGRGEDLWAAVAVLDKAMFADTGWFAIGADNRRLAGVVVPSLAAGLRLVDEPGVRVALVGRLRPGLWVVDVDVPGERGWAIAEQISSWCQPRDVWHLVRPSGGADGRCHVFVAAGDRVDELQDLVVDLRRRWKAGANLIDLRDTVRPLSSPHRATGHRTLPQGLTSVAAVRVQLRQLEAALRLAPTLTPGRRRRSRRQPVTALVPRPRPRTPLPAPWATFLGTGVRPALRGDDQSRSTYELAATTAMVRAGHTVDTAWDLIMTAHPDAMSRARGDRRWWVQRIWNRVVAATDTETHPVVDDALQGALNAAWDCLQAALWDLPVRRRPTVWRVAVALLDRIRRTGTLRVPCPERDLLEDTSLKDRGTVRDALRALHGTVGILHTDTFNPADPYTSYEFEILPNPDPGLLQNHPPSLHIPLPGRPQALMLLTALTRHPDGAPINDLARTAQLTTHPTRPLTPQQARTLRKDLEQLAAGGWAHCDATGTWHATTPDPGDETSQRQRADAIAARDALHDQIRAERHAYRRKPHCAWAVARRDAIERDHARQKAWWASLTGRQRADRARAAAARFAALSPGDQARAKHLWATRRHAQGISEADRHHTWLTSLTLDELASRSHARALWYRALPAQLRREYVQAWNAHRARHQLLKNEPLRAPEVAAAA